MAGHSQFKNIMHRKGAQDAKRAKVFTKLIRELTVSARQGGPDMDANPRLRSAVIAARGANMPKDTMDRAIKRAQGAGDGSDYVEMRYEGYGPSGVAIIIETLTDNRNRTAADIRSIFTKYGGNLGETNSVSFQFDRLGEIQYPAARASAEAMFEAALEGGALDVVSTEQDHTVYCALEDLAVVRDHLINRFGDPEAAKLVWRPKNTLVVEGDSARTLFKMLDVLEDHDDVQTVSANYDISEETLKTLDF